MNKRKVYISHRHKDREWVERFSRSLTQKGLTTWSDVNAVVPGGEIAKVIENALRASEAIVIVLDRGEEQSPWMLFELGAAIGMGKNVIVVVPQDFNLEHLPGLLRKRLSLVKSTPEETAEDLVEKIAA